MSEKMSIKRISEVPTGTKIYTVNFKGEPEHPFTVRGSMTDLPESFKRMYAAEKHTVIHSSGGYSLADSSLEVLVEDTPISDNHTDSLTWFREVFGGPAPNRPRRPPRY